VHKAKHETPAIRHLSENDLQNIRTRKLEMSHPCHNQGVERHIKLVTEAAHGF